LALRITYIGDNIPELMQHDKPLINLCAPWPSCAILKPTYAASRTMLPLGKDWV
jgi:hypothetical protein